MRLPGFDEEVALGCELARSRDLFRGERLLGLQGDPTRTGAQPWLASASGMMDEPGSDKDSWSIRT